MHLSKLLVPALAFAGVEATAARDARDVKKTSPSKSGPAVVSNTAAAIAGVIRAMSDKKSATKGNSATVKTVTGSGFKTTKLATTTAKAVKATPMTVKPNKPTTKATTSTKGGLKAAPTPAANKPKAGAKTTTKPKTSSKVTARTTTKPAAKKPKATPAKSPSKAAGKKSTKVRRAAPLFTAAPPGANNPNTGTTVPGMCNREAQSGYTYVPDDDSMNGFLSSTVFYNTSLSADAPQGYTWVWAGFYASLIQDGYLYYTEHPSYTPALCSTICDADTDCAGFTMYYERNPVFTPGANCLDPASMTRIRCAYYSQPIDPKAATNVGQWRSDFAVVISGGNGYHKGDLPAPAPEPDTTTTTTSSDASATSTLAASDDSTTMLSSAPAATTLATTTVSAPAAQDSATSTSSVGPLVTGSGPNTSANSTSSKFKRVVRARRADLRF